jgi:hypothetical protein
VSAELNRPVEYVFECQECDTASDPFTLRQEEKEMARLKKLGWWFDRKPFGGVLCPSCKTKWDKTLTNVCNGVLAKSKEVSDGLR